MRILIIEDEHLIANQLERRLLAVDPATEVVAKLASVAAVREYFSMERDIDLIMSDIRLGDGLVFEALAGLDIKTHIVFVTAYDEYAVTAFKYNGIDYILKPPTADDLTAALGRARQLSDSIRLAKSLDFAQEEKPVSFRRRFLCETADGFHRVIDAEQAACIYINTGVTLMVTDDGAVFTLPDSLDRLESELDPAMFFRANRQFIVNISAIKSTQMLWNRKLRIILKPVAGFHADIVVSREKLTPFRRWISR